MFSCGIPNNNVLHEVHTARYSATCVSTGRVGAIVGLCGKSLALMHDGELGYAVAFLVCLILLSCCYHATISTTQLEAREEVKNDSRRLLDSVLVKLVVVTAWI